jgi:hypothetical protein
VQKNILASNTLYSIYPKNGDCDLKYVLCLLNYSVIKTYWSSKYSDNKLLFPKIKGYQLQKLPIKEIPKKDHQPFIALADKMLSLNAELQNKRQRFLQRLSDNFAVTTNNGLQHLVILETFDKLDFAQFIVELKKQKITLSFKQQDDFEDYFNEYKTNCNKISAEISATDKEIDALVYGLYGLTEEEIKMVEG